MLKKVTGIDLVVSTTSLHQLQRETAFTKYGLILC